MTKKKSLLSAQTFLEHKLDCRPKKSHAGCPHSASDCRFVAISNPSRTHVRLHMPGTPPSRCPSESLDPRERWLAYTWAFRNLRQIRSGTKNQDSSLETSHITDGSISDTASTSGVVPSLGMILGTNSPTELVLRWFGPHVRGQPPISWFPSDNQRWLAGKSPN